MLKVKVSSGYITSQCKVITSEHQGQSSKQLSATILGLVRAILLTSAARKQLNYNV
jgi:hypothetical protein